MKIHCSLLLLLSSPAVLAAEMNGHFIEVQYFQGETGDNFIPLDFDGWELRGSKAFGNWQLVGGYLALDPEGVEIEFEDLSISQDAEFSYLHLGAGHTFDLGSRFKLAANVGFLRETVDAESEVTSFNTPPNGEDVTVSNSVHESDTGYFVSIGVRARASERIEAEFEHRFMNVAANRLNDWRLDLRYAFTPAFSAGLGYRDFEGDAASVATLRWSF